MLPADNILINCVLVGIGGGLWGFTFCFVWDILTGIDLAKDRIASEIQVLIKEGYLNSAFDQGTDNVKK